jgi:hypothetical protein
LRPLRRKNAMKARCGSAEVGVCDDALFTCRTVATFVI